MNTKGNLGFTPLMNAAYNGQLETVRLLIAMGADREAKTDAGCTALQGASRNDHESTARYLVEIGCRLDAVTNDGATALDIARSFERPALVALLEAAEAARRATGSSATPPPSPPPPSPPSPGARSEAPRATESALLTPEAPTVWRGEASGSALAVCAETVVFRKLAKSHVAAEDVVLELGCSFGDTTKCLAQRASRVTACDLAAVPLEAARTRCRAHDNVTFVQADVLTAAASLRRLVDEEPHVVFVDLGGNRAASALVPVLELLLRCELAAAPRLVVVKSRELHAHATAHATAHAATHAAPLAHATAHNGTAPEGGASCTPLPNAEGWWEGLAQGAEESLARLNVRAEADRETRLCFSFLNHGKCTRPGCSFRHVGPDHPDAIADAERRTHSGDWAGIAATRGGGGGAAAAATAIDT